MQDADAIAQGAEELRGACRTINALLSATHALHAQYLMYTKKQSYMAEQRH
jgi:hypothetical protein